MLGLQGIPPGAAVSAEVETLYTRALDHLVRLAVPFSLIMEVSAFDFEVVYHGEGKNEATSPIGDIFRRADYLALFAITVGEHVCQEIRNRFASQDYAMAAMLDAVASAAVDKMADTAAVRFLEALRQAGYPKEGNAALTYSPGYCGWDISGQRTLFEYLGPEQIGITLNDSCLMRPLKSVSGVIVAGRAEIHTFPPSYPACGRCETRGCRDRIQELLRK